jgi:hypothetical protein
LNVSALEYWTPACDATTAKPLRGDDGLHWSNAVHHATTAKPLRAAQSAKRRVSLVARQKPRISSQPIFMLG